MAQRRSLIAVARAPSVRCGSGCDAAGGAGRDGGGSAAARCCRRSRRRVRCSSSRVIACIGSHGGMRSARSSRSMEAAHLDRVLREPADVALHQHEILGRIVRRGRIVAAVAEPDLVHHHARLRRHDALDAGEQHEGAHRFAIGMRRQCGALRAAVGRLEIDGAADRGGRARGGGFRARARSRRAPNRHRSRARRWRPLIAARSWDCANSVKSRALSAVIAPAAETSVLQVASQVSAGPCRRNSNCIGSARSEAAAGAGH